jgi:hypothetical protein
MTVDQPMVPEEYLSGPGESDARGDWGKVLLYLPKSAYSLAPLNLPAVTDRLSSRSYPCSVAVAGRPCRVPDRGQFGENVSITSSANARGLRCILRA